MELYDHRNDTAAADFDHTENTNVAGDPANADALADLLAVAHASFAPGC
jgi:hypothetical protein